ncbi:four helix bundle protein [bacterium]|nr:four helix bundle protein [bacterium]
MKKIVGQNKMEESTKQIKTFRDLIVWQKSMNLVTDMYKLSKSFPADETYGLMLQIRRCVISIPSNIAEGYGRSTTSENIRFLRIATGSLYELQTQVEIALNLGYMDKSKFDTFYESTRELERLLSSLTKKLLERRSQ